jgi:hypothetical protein
LVPIDPLREGGDAIEAKFHLQLYVTTPFWTTYVATFGLDLLPGSPAGFGKLIAEEAGKWIVPSMVRGSRNVRRKGTGPGPCLSHDHIDGRIEVSLDLGGGALLGEPVKPFSILLM